MTASEGFNDLVRRAQAGETGAQDELFDVLRPHLERMARGLADSPNASRSASDLVQETLLRVWQKLDEFSGTGDDDESWKMFRSWVGQIAKRLNLNTRRDRKAQRRSPPQRIASLQAGSPAESEGGRRMDLPDDGPTASAAARQGEERLRVQTALSRLGDELSGTIVRMVFFEGMSLRQIAERLDLSYDQVRHRYQTGMQYLERELGPLQ